MDLKDILLANSNQIVLGIRQVGEIIENNIIAARTGGRITIPVPKELAEGLHRGNYFMFADKEGIYKLVVGPLDSEGFYFFSQGEGNIFQEGLIAHSPRMDIYVQNRRRYSANPPGLIVDMTAQEKELKKYPLPLSIPGPDGKKFADRFNYETYEPTLSVRINGNLFFMYGPIKQGQLWVRE